MTQTPIPKLILTLSVPTVISMLITNVYNLVDTAFVGVLGTSASGAVGVVYGFMSIIQAFGFMFGMGTGSIISRKLGENKVESASVYATIGFFSSFTCGILITIIGLMWLDETVRILGSTETIVPYARSYIFYILLSAPFMSSSFSLNNIVRFEGKAFLGMIGLGAGAVLNIIGDPILMFGLNLGISGAGLSTALSQVCSWLILIGMFYFGKTETKISPALVRSNPFKKLINIITTGFPSLLRQFLTSLTTIVLNLECAVYGDAAVAAMSIVNRVSFFAFATILGIGQGFQPVAGFNYGAKKYGRVKRGLYFTIFLSELIIIAECILIVYFAPELIQIFRDDPDVIEIGTRALRLMAIAQIAMPPCMSVEMLFQSTGKKLSATLLSSVRNGILFLPLLIILAHLRGLSGIEEAQPLAIALTLPVCIPFIISFFRKLPKENEQSVQPGQP